MMRRIQWTFFLLSAVIAATVILGAQQWVSTANGITTSGTVATTNSGSAALAVTGGADVGGVIQAGSGNVNLTNATGNLLPAALAAGTISTSQTFTAPMILQATTPHIFVAPSGLTWAQFRGRQSDDAGSLQFTNAAGLTEVARMTWTNTPALTISGGAGGTTGIIVGNTELTWAGVRLNSSPAQPGFLVYASGSDTGLSGNSIVTFDVDDFDTGNVFSGTTFTAPVAGKYLFDAAVRIANNDATADFMSILTRSGGGGYVLDSGVIAGTTAGNLSGGLVLNLAAAETVVVTIVTTSTNYDLIAFPSFDHRTWFSGRLMP